MMGGEKKGMDLPSTEYCSRSQGHLEGNVQ